MKKFLNPMISLPLLALLASISPNLYADSYSEHSIEINQILDTPHYQVQIKGSCDEYDITCTDGLTYTGTSKKTGKSINLTGSNWYKMGADGETPSQFLGYIFKNGNITYAIREHDDIATLTVSTPNKQLINEQGKWLFDNQANKKKTSYAEQFHTGKRFEVSGQEKFGMAGYVFRIKDKQSKKSFDYKGEDNEALFYLDVYHNYLLLDEGTGGIRSIIIVDMSNGNTVFKQGGLTESGGEGNGIHGNKFYYWQQVDKLPKGQIQPKCDFMEGVPKTMYHNIGKWVLNLNTLKSKPLGEYECQYFE